MKRCLIASFALFASLCLPVQVQALPIVSVGSATVTVGNIFTIPVSITGAVDVSSFQFSVSFNPSILQVTATGVTESAFFTEGDITTFIPGFLLSGLIDGVSDAQSGLQPAVNGNGDLAFIEFQAIAPGTSPLTLSSVFLNTLDSGFTVANGSVCVNPLRGNTCAQGGGGTAPEPGALALLLAALGLVTWRSRPHGH